MTEQEFYNFSIYVQSERFYHPNWAYVIFKAKFGKWLTKAQKQAGKAEEPSKDFLDWLDSHHKKWSDAQKHKEVKK